MSEPTNAEEAPKSTLRKEPLPKDDPYPRMILVCFGIFGVLIVIIFSFIFYDFMHRTEQDVRYVAPPASAPVEAPASP